MINALNNEYNIFPLELSQSGMAMQLATHLIIISKQGMAIQPINTPNLWGIIF